MSTGVAVVKVNTTYGENGGDRKKGSEDDNQRKLIVVHMKLSWLECSVRCCVLLQTWMIPTFVCRLAEEAC